MTIRKLDFSKSESMPTVFNLKDYLKNIADFYGNVVEAHFGGSIWVGVKENQHSLILLGEDHSIQYIIDRIDDEVPWVTFTSSPTHSFSSSNDLNFL